MKLTVSNKCIYLINMMALCFLASCASVEKTKNLKPEVQLSAGYLSYNNTVQFPSYMSGATVTSIKKHCDMIEVDPTRPKTLPVLGAWLITEGITLSSKWLVNNLSKTIERKLKQYNFAASAKTKQILTNPNNMKCFAIRATKKNKQSEETLLELIGRVDYKKEGENEVAMRFLPISLYIKNDNSLLPDSQEKKTDGKIFKQYKASIVLKSESIWVNEDEGKKEVIHGEYNLLRKGKKPYVEFKLSKDNAFFFSEFSDDDYEWERIIPSSVSNGEKTNSIVQLSFGVSISGKYKGIDKLLKKLNERIISDKDKIAKDIVGKAIKNTLVKAGVDFPE